MEADVTTKAIAVIIIENPGAMTYLEGIADTIKEMPRMGLLPNQKEVQAQ